MSQSYDITHYYHSGFSVAGDDTLLVFDYWRGERGEVTEKIQLTPEMLRSFRNVFVFISHEHPDHMDPVVFTWNAIGNVSYIVSSDMPVGTRGKTSPLLTPRTWASVSWWISAASAFSTPAT